MADGECVIYTFDRDLPCLWPNSSACPEHWSCFPQDGIGAEPDGFAWLHFGHSTAWTKTVVLVVSPVTVYWETMNLLCAGQIVRLCLRAATWRLNGHHGDKLDGAAERHNPLSTDIEKDRPLTRPKMAWFLLVLSAMGFLGFSVWMAHVPKSIL